MATKIAIIGLACRYPGAHNTLELWENILCRRRQFRQVDQIRSSLPVYPPLDGPEHTSNQHTHAALLEFPDLESSAGRVFPGAQQLAKCLLTLPTHSYLRDEDFEHIAAVFQAVS